MVSAFCVEGGSEEGEFSLDHNDTVTIRVVVLLEEILCCVPGGCQCIYGVRKEYMVTVCRTDLEP